MDYKYAYLIGVLSILFPIWLFLLIRRKDLRKEILLTSIVIGLLGPFSELLYLRDYWHPETIGTYPFGPEGFLFGFLLSGIAVSIEVVRQRRTTCDLRPFEWGRSRPCFHILLDEKE
ncbi:MAG: Uncharacterized protein FD167_4513 [bacterium]|nr:MAG: Uncharacterized protein FD167_4513 [bacterium]